MKGYLAKPRPVEGLGPAIIETKHLEFFVDIVNNRNLEAKQFFSYIKKYGDTYKINQKIEYISYNMSIMKANKLKLIIDYKKAEIDNNNEKLEQLKESFSKIKNVRISTENANVKGSNVFYDLQSKEFNKEEVIGLINDYLNGKELDKKEITHLNTRIKKHIKHLDYKRFNDFSIKASNIEVVTKEEINQIIILLNYFIINIRNNSTTLDNLYSDYKIFSSNIKGLNKQEKKLERKKINLESKQELDKIDEIDEEINIITKEIDKEELKLKKQELLIKNFLPEISNNLSDECKNNISKLYISKSSKLKKYLRDYSFVLEYFLSFRDEMKYQENLANLKIKLNSIDLEEDYIKDLIDKTRTIIKYYKNINSFNLSDEKLDDMKKDYISKVYKPNN